MSFKRRLYYFLVHTLMVTNRQAKALVANGAVQINGETIHDNCMLDALSEIKVNGQVLRAAKQLVYIKFNKPRGFESTLSSAVPNNLATFFNGIDGLAIAGRLDKDSEGLLLLSNDGKWIEQTCHPKFEKEKAYEVSLDKMPDEAFLKAFAAGVNIGGYVTQPCVCEWMSENVIGVILKEGKNRQIRRMCAALGYKVLRLQRQRTAGIALEQLPPGQFEYFHLKDFTKI